MKVENNQSTRNKSIIRVVLVAASILAIPLIAMQFTDEVEWGVMDFIIIGALLLTTGFTYEFVIRKVGDTKRRTILAIVLFAVAILIWADLAVGIFGLPFSGE